MTNELVFLTPGAGTVSPPATRASTEQKLQITTLLDRLCEHIELPEGRREEVEQRYRTMGEWLDAENSPLRPYHPRIHSQGSIRIGTTVRPLTGDNYDLDSVCRFASAPFRDPALLKKALLDRLRAHDTYRDMTKEKPRCARVEYADFFHHDIMPCVPDLEAGGSCVLVPDKKLEAWKTSDPEGYAKRFDAAAARMPKSSHLEAFSAKRAAANANVEPLPVHNGVTKEPLRRCVQIIKRHRDEHFREDATLAPISVVLTTLAMHAYEVAVETGFFDTPLDLITAVVAGMPAHVQQTMLWDGQTYYHVPNPTNPRENFAEKWNANPLLAEAFYRWHRSALATLERLAQVGENEGMDKVGRLLGEGFGRDAANEAVRSFSADVQRAVATRHASVTPSGIVTLGTPSIVGAPGLVAVRQHRFYGR